MSKTENFIKKAKEIHGDKYDYSKVKYVNNRIKVCIICPEHGEFWQVPYSHLSGRGCIKCAKRYSPSKEEWIKEVKNIHKNKYDYSKVNYINHKTKVCIICPEHGEFWQIPMNHKKGKGCPVCSGNQKLSKEEFIKRAKIVHGDKYNYSKVEYVNSDTKVCIICPEHGEFWQTPYKHVIRKQGCYYCNGTKRYNSEDFIKKAKEIHGDKYDYSKVNYINNHTKVCIICPKHGEFWQSSIHHINRKQCCPKCNKSVLEENVKAILNFNNIKFIQEKRFKWLKYKKSLRLDFYLPDYNIAIECQGEQHYKPVDFAGKGEKWANNEFEKNIKRDNLKKELCEENNINILYIKYKDKKIEKKIVDFLKNNKK